MATPSAGLYARLGAVGALTALVGDRIYPGMIPPDKVPAHPGDAACLAFVRADEPEEELLGGNADIRQAIFELVSLGGTYDACEAVHEAVRDACRRARGTFGGLEVVDTLLWDGEGPEYLYDPTTYEARQVIALRYRGV